MKTNETDERERAAWKEVERRLQFLAEMFGRTDATTARMATDNLVEALKIHSPFYEERSRSRLN
jgi:predicted DNA-binding protein